MQGLSLAAPFWVKTLEETHVGPGPASSRVPGKLPTEQKQPVKTGWEEGPDRDRHSVTASGWFINLNGKRKPTVECLHDLEWVTASYTVQQRPQPHKEKSLKN